MIKKTLRLLLLCGLSLLYGTALSGDVTCRGTMWNPAMTNWNNALPVTTAGVSSGGMYLNPALMNMPAVCYCKYVGPVPVPGVGMTYWQPMYIAEVTNMPGCMSSLGGIDVLPDSLVSPAMSTGDLGNSSSKDPASGNNLRNMQVHWMNYPLFGMMDLFASGACQSGPAGFAVAGMTEINPLWQEETLANIFYPLTFLVSNPIAQLACIPDVATSTLRNPTEPLFWCVGSQGNLYPITGWSGILDNGTADTNVLILAKYMQSIASVGALLQSIGPTATCFSHYNPFLVRGQFRIEPIQPVPSMSTITFGMPVELWGSTPPLLPEMRIDNNFLIWQGRQCCLL